MAQKMKDFYLRFWGIRMFKELLRYKVNSCANCKNNCCEFDHYCWLDLRFHLDDDFIFQVYHDHDANVIKRILAVLDQGDPAPVTAHDLFEWFASEGPIFYSMYLRENIERLRYWVKREYVRLLVEHRSAMCDYVWKSMKDGRSPWKYDWVIELDL